MAKAEVAHEIIVRVRNDYAAGKPLRAIRAETGLSSTTIYKLVDGTYGGCDLPPLQRRLQRRNTAGREGRATLIARLWNTADRQVREIDKRLRHGRQEPGERERDARVLAVLVRTLRELAAFDEASKAAQAVTDRTENDDMPTDIDEFRNELARRINAFVGERQGGGIPEHAESTSD